MGTMRYENINNIQNIHALKYKERLNTNSIQEMRKCALAKEKYDLNRPAQAISFGGSKNLTEAFVKSGAVNKVIEVVADNEALYSAILSLVVAGIIKPQLVLAMPGSEDKDKQIVATKNFLQAFIGSFLNITVGANLVKKSIDVVKNDLKLVEINEKTKKLQVVRADNKNALEVAKSQLIKEQTGFFTKIKDSYKSSTQNGKLKAGEFFSSLNKKPIITCADADITKRAKELVEDFSNNRFKIFQNNEEYIAKLLSKEALNCGTLKDAFETFWKNSTGAITAIGKAKISSLLLPGVMAAMFAKKNLESEQAKKAKEVQYSTLVNTAVFKKAQRDFYGSINSSNDLKQPSFTGNINTSIAKGLETIAITKPFQKAVEVLSHSKKPSARMADLESALITAYWINNTTHSKKIDPDQKLGLNIHTGLVTIVSSACAFIIDWLFDGIIDNCIKKYKENAMEIAKDISGSKSFVGSDKSYRNIFRGKNISKELADKGQKAVAEFLNINSTIALKEERKAISKKSLSDFESEIQNLKNNKNYVDCKKIIDSYSGKYSKYLSKLKSLTVFTIVVRLAVPVLMVPFSGKLKRFVKEMQDKMNSNKQNTEKAK